VPTSRYEGVEVATLQVSDGRGGHRDVRFLRRRPAGERSTAPPLTLHRIAEDDRLDLISSRYYGDPTAFWQVCDANAALDPAELVGPDTAGGLLEIPAPEA
jgi:hypothetical protein